jgi:transcriptional repressor NrdR
VKRRRQCAACGFRFSTVEQPVREEVSVQKRNGSVEEFDRQKIVSSVRCALKKGNRRQEEVEELVEGILKSLLSEKEKCISSERIGEEVLRSLQRFDELAYVRYLSVHRTFANLEEFRKRIEEETRHHGDTL